MEKHRHKSSTRKNKRVHRKIVRMIRQIYNSDFPKPQKSKGSKKK